MKKIVAVLVVLVVLFSVPALGEELDLLSMTLDELVNMQILINDEMENRLSLPNMQMSSGIFVVGKDIEPGKYEFIYGEAYVNVRITMFANETQYVTYQRTDKTTNSDEMNALRENAFNVEYVKKDTSCYLGLEDGMVVAVSGGYGFLQEVNPIWAPDK